MAVIQVPANTQQTLTIGKIEFEGLQRLTAEEVIAGSGLKVGQTFDLAVLDAAAQKLADSGLFKSLGYKTHGAANAVTIIFQVEESKAGNSPVLFDNFIWFTDEELTEVVRREVPSFTGNAPDAGEMINSITAALQKHLKTHNIGGTVEYMPSQDAPGSARQDHVFSVSGIKMPVCTMHFPGAQNVSEGKLIQSSQELAGNDYSRKFSSVFALKNLVPVYREVGQLRAAFSRPLAKPASDPKCKGGVDLTIPVEEGAIYSWEKTEWADNHAVAVPELDAALGLKAGEVANGLKLDKGLIAVKKAYGRKGYLELRYTAQPEFDEAAKRVTYQIAVKEGPQYRMGNLIVKGYSEVAEKLLRAKWELKAGDAFNQDYLDEFMNKSVREIVQKVSAEYLAFGRALPKFISARQPNKKTLTVDVTFEIKD